MAVKVKTEKPEKKPRSRKKPVISCPRCGCKVPDLQEHSSAPGYWVCNLK